MCTWGPIHERNPTWYISDFWSELTEQVGIEERQGNSHGTHRCAVNHHCGRVAVAARAHVLKAGALI